MPRKLVALATLVVLLVVAHAGTAPTEAKGGFTRISGGDLPHPISMPFEDAWAFSYPRLPNITWDQFSDWPRLLNAAPQGTGLAYVIEGGLLNELFYKAGIEMPAEQQYSMAYYPEAQALEIRIEPSSRQLWFRLDEEREILLNRYITLGRVGLLPEEPSILDVLTAEYKLSGALAPVEVDGRPLTREELGVFWALAASKRWPEIPVTISRDGAKSYLGSRAASDERVEAVPEGFAGHTEREIAAAAAERVEAMVYGYPEYIDLVFTSSDGRRLTLAYYPVTSVLAGMPTNWCCTASGRGIPVASAIADSFAAALGFKRTANEDTPDTGKASTTLSATFAAVMSDADEASPFAQARPRPRAIGPVVLMVVLGLTAVLATAGALARSGYPCLSR